MKKFKTCALAGIFALSASFASTAQADTVGCDSYGSYSSYEASHWEQVIAELQEWLSTHSRWDPYYYTKTSYLLLAQHKLDYIKSSYTRKRHHHCKVDVSPC